MKLTEAIPPEIVLVKVARMMKFLRIFLNLFANARHEALERLLVEHTVAVHQILSSITIRRRTSTEIAYHKERIGTVPFSMAATLLTAIHSILSSTLINDLSWFRSKALVINWI